MRLALRKTPVLRIPRGVLGMVVLILLVEHFFARNALQFTRPEYWDWAWSSRASTSRSRGCAVLCFGTSRLQQSLIPTVVEGRSGLRTLNLSACWGQPPAYYFLLKRALDSGSRPAALIVEYHPNVLAGSYWEAVRYWPDLLKPGEGLDLARTARDPDFFATTTLARWLPSVKDRFQIRANLMEALGGQCSEMPLSTLTGMRNRNVNRGAFVLARNATYRGEISAGYEAALLPATWECTETNRTYIERFLSLAASRGIPVYWTLPPFCPELQARRESRGLDARYAALVRSLQARHPNLTVLDAQESGYGADVFVDACHLDRVGACALSEAVADAIRGHASRSVATRWVALPRFRESGSAAAVEDLAMSQSLIRERQARRR